MYEQNKEAAHGMQPPKPINDTKKTIKYTLSTSFSHIMYKLRPITVTEAVRLISPKVEMFVQSSLKEMVSNAQPKYISSKYSM